MQHRYPPANNFDKGFGIDHQNNLGLKEGGGLSELIVS